MPANLEWQKQKQSGEQPRPRSGHTMNFAGQGRYLMYGGITKAGQGQKVKPISDVYQLRMQRQDWVWEKLEPQGDEMPLPRAQHVAVTIPGSDRMFIFGGHASPTVRLNDSWWLNTKECIWSRVRGDKQAEENKESFIGGPPPRANAAACYHKGKVYVYGGHGGLNYARVSLDDIYVFDCENETWEQIVPIQGAQPLPLGRGGHTIFCHDDPQTGQVVMYSYGGWNSETNYNNVIQFNFETMEWYDPDIYNDVARWNHSAIMVEAIPSWKYFIMGGESAYFSEGAARAFGSTVDTCCVMDMETKTWTTISPESKSRPPCREYSSLAYDADDSKLIVFGGWNSGWLNDLYTLNVSKIVGPPYAIASVFPALSQLSGNVDLIIKGIGFRDNNPLVYFTVGNKMTDVPTKNSVNVSGTYISDTEIHCKSPNYSIHGPKDCVVQLAISNKDLTTSWCDFSFFLNTRAVHSLCFGCGLMENMAINEPIEFFIQARNDNRENRQSGRDEFQVTIKSDDEEKQDIPCQVIDKDDGQYSVIYTAPRACRMKIKVEFRDEQGFMVNVRGSPYSAGFDEEVPAKTNITIGPSSQHNAKHLTELLQEFMSKTSEGCKITEKDLTDVRTLLDVKDHVETVTNRNDEIMLMLDQLQETLRLLLANNLAKESQQKQCNKLFDEWIQLKKLAKETAKEIKQLVINEGSKNVTYISKLEEDLKSYMAGMKKRQFYKYDCGRENSLELLNQIYGEIEIYVSRIADLGYNATKFGNPEAIEVPEKQVEHIRAEVNNMKALWDHIAKCQSTFETYMQTGWPAIEPFEMEDVVKKFMSGLKNMKVDRRCDAYEGLMKEIKKWLTFLPLIGELRNKAMRERHWDMIRKLVGRDFQVDETLFLRDIYDMNLAQYAEDVEECTDQAKQEAKMEATLQKLQEVWQEIKFEFHPHKDTEYSTAKLVEEDFEMLEEDQTKVTAMLGSRYLATFEDQINMWNRNLELINNVVSSLREVQQSWGYLENLFIHSEEVRRELPKESDEFVQIDTDVKFLLKQAKHLQFAITFSIEDGYLQKIESANEKLAKCEKALQRFMEDKKTCFPRFYFVSPADLLDILSNGNVPTKVMPHMPKIFQAIETLKLESGQASPAAVGMQSCVGIEYVQFTEPLKLIGKVEVYLQDVINVMCSSLKKIAGASLKKFAQYKRTEWLKLDCSQCTLLVGLANWVINVEKGFKNGDLPATKEMTIGMLNDLIYEVQDSKLPKDVRMKVMCLITMDAHSRDIIGDLIDANCTEVDVFQWQSQLKAYWDEEKQDYNLKIADASFYYGYEYLGNGPRLVVTPLTDRIYVTATQALHLMMGCAPAGPAGTGKTETTKDLASSMGKAVYVFNCSDQMDYLSLAGIFKGLAASGSWGCFDEFNRLVPEVLSVCSVQFKSVTDAIKAGATRFTIQEAEISLDPSCGAFITMNPGYIGRSELPEGLKALFRPITVVVPDLELICQNMLMAEGFVDAKDLARKFTTLYFLCRDLLSAAKHYDWGLRAIKSVLVVAGGFKRAEPDLAENAILMRALRDFNLPKIAAEDLEIFGGLLGDLFPAINPPRNRDLNFEGVIEAAAEETKMYGAPEFILKIVQLQELMEIRHSVFVMGPPGCGKSQTWKTLGKANNKAGNKTSIIDINPKVVSTNEFYGVVHLQTREWIDGLFSCKLRDFSKETDTNPKWIILDGDLDANWIESMNSVMDDNKLLTLASNERISLKPHMKLIFEIRNLNHATPATVSRAGILYISDDDGYQWRAYVKSWIKHSPYEPERKEALQRLFDNYVDECYQYMRKTFKTIVPVQLISQVTCICKLLEIIMQLNEVKGLEFIFVFACVWCMGAGLEIQEGNKSRLAFDKFWREKFKTIKFPTKGTVFDYYVDTEHSKLVDWNNLRTDVVENSIDTSRAITNYTVPTGDTIASQYIMKNFITIGIAPMLVGNAGCGKTQIINGLLNELTTTTEDYKSQTINFNFFTDSTLLQRVLESQLEKKGGAGFGPPGKVKLIYFVDDLNMPKLDPYETQTAIALVRQHLDYSHWYDKQKLIMKKISNTQYIASMNATAGSFVINPRLQRWFWLLAVNFPEGHSLNTIYSAFMTKHFQKFKGTVSEQVGPIIKQTLQLHHEVAMKFRKTAANFHYEFNVRHLTNVFQGILTAKPEAIKEAENLVKLWVHECERIYGDRLVSPADLAGYRAIVSNLAKKHFGKFNLTKYFQENNPEPLVFANFTESLDDKLYDQFPNQEKMSEMLGLALREYNEINPVMPLVLFEDAMKHICKVTRIISAAQGHALMVGVGGSGKQSLSRLASFICAYSPVTIVISASYNINDLKVDLQAMFRKCGEKDEGIMFQFTEGQIKEEKFLVCINDLLSSGEIADLFVQEDIDSIIGNCTPAAKSDGVTPTPQNVWRYFIDRVKRNLHMALCFSPSDEFRSRARKFPALINCTVIDWFHPWPQQALLSVATKFLEEVQMASDEERNAVISFLPFSFTTVTGFSEKVLQKERRYVYTTPKSFLELITLFKTMLGKKRTELEDNREKYDKGVIKLRETGEQVAELEEGLKITSVVVEEKKLKANEQAAIVGVEKTKVEAQSDIANAESIKCAKIAEEVAIMMANVQTELDAALPALAKAESALEGLKVKDFQMLKALTNPPPDVKTTFGCVIHLLCNVDPLVPVTKTGKLAEAVPWKCVPVQLKNPQVFLDKLKNYKNNIDNGEVPESNFKAIQSTLDDETFKPELIKAKSDCAGGLCDWVRNISVYFAIFTTVAPKRQAVEEAEIALGEANEKKATMEAEVAELNAALAVLQATYQEVMDEKEAAEAEAYKCEQKLDLAQRLVTALGDESVRWAQAIVDLDVSLNVLIGDVLMASAFVSYVGPFNKKFRVEIMEGCFLPFFKANNIPMTENSNPLQILTTPAQVATWNNNKLPSDQVSVENGAILTNSERYSLIIDPQLQGITWLKDRMKDTNLQVTRLSNPKLVKTIEFAIEKGDPVMIENLDNAIDAVIQPVYARAVIKKGRNRYIRMGDKELSLHKDFALYLHTKLSNPHYQPEIQAECTLINFTVTESGLEDQLLDLVVLKERPDLSAQNIELIQAGNNFKIQLGELEADLLYRLAHAEGDILDDIELVENLEKSKMLSTEINEKMKVMKVTQVQIKQASEFYRPAANRGALVFFLMNELYMIHSFYRFSLDSFIIVIKRAIDIVAAEMAPKKKEIVEGEEEEEEPEEEEKSDEDEEGKEKGGMSPGTLRARVEALTESITYQAFNYTRRGTFDRHKLLIATLLCLRIMIRKGLLKQDEVDALIMKEISLDPPPQPENLKMIAEALWPSVVGLQKVKVFEDLIRQMESEGLQWRKWYADANAESCELPRAHKDISLFHRLLLLRAMRPDRLSGALTQFVRESMGDKYIEQPSLDFYPTYLESNYVTPIFFVLFPGEDPTPMVERVGRRVGKTEADRSFTNISMGQGQEKTAEDCLTKSAKEGNWIMLQNVHLMIPWMKGFERKLEIAVNEDCHPDFRCFISSEPPPLPHMEIIPEAILQNSLKVANEAPQDLKSNLRRAFSKFEQDQFDKAEGHKISEYKALLFGLCMYHSLILGRKKFGSQGWSRNYSFNDGDLTVCGDVLHNYLAQYEKVPYADLQYLYGEIMYGGHITDEMDRRTNNTYLQRLIIPTIMQQMQLTMTAGFKSPDPMKFDRAKYESYIETNLPQEIPQMFGLHPNAEIGYLTTQAETLFTMVQAITGGSSAAAEGGDKVGDMITLFLERCPEQFQMLDLFAKATTRPPFTVVCLQECERMNNLLAEIKITLIELDAGLKGTLNITENMEELAAALGFNAVPPSWIKKSYFSKKTLLMWLEDLVLRCEQLERWSDEFETPNVLWISGLFNPMSFLTAIMQITARSQGLPLDDMCLKTEVTNSFLTEDMTEAPVSGAYINGFTLEGAGWEAGRNGEQGYLCDMILKELSPELPIVHITAIRRAERQTIGFYICPVYFTTARGAAQLVTKFDIAMESEDSDDKSWILSGVALFLAPEQ